LYKKIRALAICRCRPGYADISSSFERLPGRHCIEAVNECLDSALNDCSENAICEDAKEGYICTCRQGFVDASPNITHYPGRVCRKPKQEKQSDTIVGAQSNLDSCDPKKPKCGSNEVCSDRKARGQFICECAENAFRFKDGTCRFYAACVGENDCDKNAVCANAFDTYKCQCRPGYIDISPDPERKPGRVCKECWFLPKNFTNFLKLIRSQTSVFEAFFNFKKNPSKIFRNFTDLFKVNQLAGFKSSSTGF
uniref:EGF-like domain-containing protein n=1 Tax=Gongylonema pulchrum TaxID=637853 RepID=A0A183D6A3_9BILA